MPLASLLDFWKHDRDTAPNLVTWRTLPARPSQTYPFPTDLPATVRQTLVATGIHSLYSHQLEAWTHSQAGENIILATSTASEIGRASCRKECRSRWSPDPQK